jgi:hypothetical protein
MAAPGPSARRAALAAVTTTGSGLPSRGVVYGPEGCGKTSLGAAAPAPVFVMTRGETGLATLIDAARVPETPHFPEVTAWPDLLAAITALTDEPHEYRTLVIDTLNGAERLCHEHVCGREFGGRWGRDGFTAYNTGYDVALADWRELLTALDRLRAGRRMGVLALCHSKVAPFRNPEGPDYDRFTPDLHPRTWGLTHKWADYVLFLNFETVVDAGKAPRAKGLGGTRRVLHAERAAAFDAKNRHGLPPRIDGGAGASEAWANLAAAMRASRARPQTTVPPAGVPQEPPTDPEDEMKD